MKLNVFTITFACFLCYMIGALYTKIGTVSECSEEPFGWLTFFVLLLFVIVMFGFGYFAGINDDVRMEKGAKDGQEDTGTN